MNKQHRFLFLVCGFFLVSALALWLGYAAPRAYANVTLVNFTATSKPGQKDVYVYWETATEFDTIGFFVTRKDTPDGSYAQLGEFIPHEDSSGLVGAQYYFTDTTTVLNQTYYYRLEEITPSQPEHYGPITVTAGVPATPTPTATRTPTATPSPTATSTPQSNTTAASNPTISSGSVVAATPQVLTGETITPLPTSSGSSSSPAVTATSLAKVLGAQQHPQAVATSLPAVLDAAVATVVPLQPAAAAVAQASKPTLVPPDTVPARSEPAVIVTEAAPIAATGDPSDGSALLLVAAAFLFLGIAFVILRQARQ